jgi:glycosyl transferase family 25
MAKKSPLPVWVLNLKQDKHRLRFMQRQLRNLRLEFTVVKAVNGNLLTSEEWNRYSKKKAIRVSGRELTPGEVGCALSHARMWERMDRENLREVLILEDDVLISEALPRILAKRSRLPKDWEMVNFSTDAPQEPFGRFLTDIYRASRHKDWADRSSAYLLRLRGARKLLQHVYPIGHTADGLTWRTDITGLVSYGIYPRVVILSELDSSIWSEGGIRPPGFATRKYREFLAMGRATAVFFGMAPLIRKIRNRIHSDRHPISPPADK